MNNWYTEELSTRYSSQKSFYGKAQLIYEESNGILIIKLKSYNTIVAQITKTLTNIIYEHFGFYSVTTSRHQKAFFLYFGLSESQYKQLQKQYKIIEEINDETESN